MLVYLTCSKKNKNVALYKPISFVAEFHYMSYDLTSDILIKTSQIVQSSRDVTGNSVR